MLLEKKFFIYFWRHGVAETKERLVDYAPLVGLCGLADCDMWGGGGENELLC